MFVNHTSIVSGGEHALLDLLVRLPRHIRATVACPQGGLAERVVNAGINVIPLGGTAGSLRLHAIHTPRGVYEIVRDALTLRKHARRLGVHLVHANSTRAGLMAVTSSRLGGPPAVVHVRDCVPPGRVTNAIRRYIAGGAAGVIAVSQYAAARFLEGIDRGIVHVVSDAVDAALFDPRQLSKEDARTQLGLPMHAPILGIIGQIAPLKGQREAISALELVHESEPDAHLLIVGEPKFVDKAARFNSAEYFRSLHRLVQDRGLTAAVHFLGDRDDMPVVLRAIDVVLAPSWEEGFGRAVIEAMAMERAVVATDVGGPAEVIRDGADALLLPPMNPGLWAQTAADLLKDDGRRARMGRMGRGRVIKEYSHARHVEGVVSAYDDVMKKPARC